MTVAGARTARYDELVDALTELRQRLAGARLTLETPDAAQARTARKRLVDQLDDYVLPRLQRLDAPLLVVVGGSTGAGKSTLVNSLVGADVSRSGVLRPTTRGPVLVHHPGDGAWFTDRRLLPGLPRVTGDAADPGTLLLAAHDAVPPGLALLDAPDVDSVVTANRELAAQLLGAADLWLFLTTAARYADAVPWGFLREASERSAAVAIVLDRVPPEAWEEVSAHLTQMLREEGLGDSPLFVVPETALPHGRLPEAAVEPLRSWLRRLAEDAPARAAVARATLEGVLSSYAVRVPAFADALAAQEEAATSLRDAARTSYDAAADTVDEAMRDGSLLRGEVLARWQDVVGTGDLLRGLQSRVGQLRDRLVAAATGRPPPTEELAVALESNVEALVHAAADRAAEHTVAYWRREPAGRALLGNGPDGLDRSSATLAERTQRAVRDWEGAVLELVRREGAGKRRTSQVVSYGINGVALSVMVLVFASTGGLTGGEVVVAGGASALSQKLLEALLGDQAVRDLAAKARVDLRQRVDALLAEERARFLALVDATGEGAVPAADVRAAARAVAVAQGRAT